MGPTVIRNKLYFLGHDELINPMKTMENYCSVDLCSDPLVEISVEIKLLI